MFTVNIRIHLWQETNTHLICVLTGLDFPLINSDLYWLYKCTLYGCKNAPKKHIGFCRIQIWVNVDQDANDVTAHQAHWVTFGKGRGKDKSGIKWRYKSTRVTRSYLKEEKRQFWKVMWLGKNLVVKFLHTNSSIMYSSWSGKSFGFS